jgi:hypothetical protein
MDEINFLWLAVGFFIGYLYHTRVATKRLLDDPDSMIEMLTKYKNAKQNFEKIVSSVTDGEELNVERQQGNFYLFTKDSDEFISQGATLEEALNKAKKRFPDRTFRGIIPADRAKEWGLSSK